QQENCFPGTLDQSVRVISGLIQVPLEQINVLETDDRAVNFVVPGFVGAYAQNVPAPIFFLHFLLVENGAVNSLADQFFQVLNIQVRPDFTQAAVDIGRNQVQQFLRGRSEPAYA